jgi:hypothetical protein
MLQFEVTLTFVPLNATSFFCLDAFGLLFPLSFLKFKSWQSSRQNLEKIGG